MKGIEDLRENTSVYNPENDEEMSAVQKKFEKKYPDALDNLKCFGQNQNEFNNKVLDCLEELADHCKRLEDALSAEVNARKRDTTPVYTMKKDLDTVKLRSTLNSRQLEKVDGALEKISGRTENYVLHIAPGARLRERPKGCREAKIDSIINMPEHIEEIKRSTPTQREKKLKELEKLCMKTFSRELSYYNAYDEIGIDFYGTEKYAEIIYRNLSKNSIYKIENGSVSGDSGKYFVYCGETAAVPEKAVLKSGMIFITGRKPFEGLSEEFIEDLRFLNDCGIHSYTAMNNDAYNELKKLGFRCIAAASAEELATGKVISAVESGIENAVPSGAEKYSRLVRMLDNEGIGFARSADDIIDFILNVRNSGDFTLKYIQSLEKTASAAIIKNYFNTADISSLDISQDTDGEFDFITGFDYINHFDYKTRKTLYKKARNQLKSGGLLLFSGKDPVTSIKLRAIEGWERYPIYEAMWTSKQLVTELEENGFRVRYLIPTGTGLYDMMPSKYKDIPSLYIVGAVPIV